MAMRRRSLSQQDGRDRPHRSPCSLSLRGAAWSVTSAEQFNARTGCARTPDLRNRRAYRTTLIWRTGPTIRRGGIALGSSFRSVDSHRCNHQSCPKSLRALMPRRCRRARVAVFAVRRTSRWYRVWPYSDLPRCRLLRRYWGPRGNPGCGFQDTLLGHCP
jgi:hypothetical protein